MSHESLSHSFGIRLVVDGDEYVFEPDMFLPLSPKEAVLINILVLRLAGAFGNFGNVAAREAWARGFLDHNNLWRHFKKLAKEDPPMTAFWKC